MTRITRRAADQMRQNNRTAQPDRVQIPRRRMPREPLWVKLDDHLPAPTDDFESASFTPTTVTAQPLRRRDNNSIDTHYELDDSENRSVTVVNRFPWVWCYKHSYVLVERNQGEWVVRNPYHTELKVKSVGAHNKGATQAAAVHWEVTGGTNAATGETIQVYNPYDDIGSDIWAKAVWIINRWEYDAAEC